MTASEIVLRLDPTGPADGFICRAITERYRLTSTDLTEREAVYTLGPQWSAVVSLARRAADLTPVEVERLATTPRPDGIDDAWGIARDVLRMPAYREAWHIVRDIVHARADIEQLTGGDLGAWPRAKNVISDALMASLTWDRARPDGYYTTVHRSMLAAAWSTAVGPLAEWGTP